MHLDVRRALCAVVVVSTLWACSEVEPEPAGAESERESPVRAVASAVVGGEMISPCQWPSAVHVNSCTATLIHPRVVTTAAHCLSGTTARVMFGNSSRDAGAFTLTGTCKAGARGAAGGSTSRDWGYCVIPEDDRVKKIPITPPIVGCEAEMYLKAGATAWVVGWGSTTAAGAGGYATKRQVAVKVNRVTNGIVDVGDRDHGACHGDSGGPVYVQVGDGMKNFGWRVAGSTSGAGSANCDCTCNTIYVDIKMHVAAIEENEGIDVTPCTNAAGEWDPSEACQGFSANPQMGTGTFPECKIDAITDRVETCGTNPFPATGTAGSDAMAGSGGSAGSAGSAGMSGASGMAGMPGMAGMSGAGAGSAGMSAAGGAGGAVGMAGMSGMNLAGIGGNAGMAGITGTMGFAANGAPGFGPPTAGMQTTFPVGAGGLGGTGGMPPAAGDSDEGCSVAAVGARDRSNPLASLLLAWFACAWIIARRRRA